MVSNHIRVFFFLLVAVVLGGVAYFVLSPVGLPEPDLSRSVSIRNDLARCDPVTFVALGNSITAGTNAPVAYPQRCREILEARYPGARIEFINAGRPGDTAEGGLRRLNSEVLSHDPDVVFVEFGWNDLRNGVSEEKFAEALSEMVDRIRNGAGAIVYLMTTTHVDVALANWKVKGRNRIIRQIAREKDCGLIDLYNHFQSARKKGVSIRELMSEDRIHPSAKGQELIAAAVARELVETAD